MIFAFLDRMIRGVKRRWRKRVFLDTIGSQAKNLWIVGDYTLINRNVEIGDNTIIYPGVMLFGQGKIKIGNNVNIGNNTVIYASDVPGGVEICDNVMIAADCYIIDNDHGTRRGTNIIEQEDVVSKVFIGNDVWLGTGVKILRGSIIEDGAVIGANAVVKGNVKANMIVAGVPAKKLGERK